tara:strand:+ start:45 stop:1313 length:1269 start_codon:yes stop_codon:yes gene_type:complete
MFEPLLFFVFTYNNNFLGVSLSVSRILQILVLFLLAFSFIIKFVRNKKIIVENSFFPENKYLVLYFVLLFLASFFGIINGSYNLPAQADLFDIDTAYPYFKRSVFEYIILFFNIFYFVILPRNLIKTKTDFDYLFSVFKFFLIVTLLVGYADYIFSKFGAIDLVARHIRDGVEIGGRFHGLAGEPRQAAVHMVFNISMYILYCQYFEVKIKIWVMFLILLSLILTTSMSLFIGVLFFGIFLFIFKLIKLKYMLILLLVITSMLSIDNVQNYKNYLMAAWQILEAKEELPYFLRILRGEIYPIYDIIKKIQNRELVTVFFGNGPGSASAINNFYIGDYLSSRNPNAQIVRSLSDSGILGTLVFIISMVWPIKYFTRNTDKKTRNLYIVSMLMVLSVSFAVRSSVVFIYLGILTSFLHYNEKKI